MEESILISIKKLLGLTADYLHFDLDIIMDINAAFTILAQLGVGPEKGFQINGKEEKWSDFVSDEANLGLIKSYIHKRVRLLFDTSTLTTGMIEVIERQIKEDEWRLNVAMDRQKEEKNGE